VLQKSLAIRENVLGHHHPDTATSLNDLALLLAEQGGGWRQALLLHERALAIRERALGAEHLSTAESLNNLALAVQEDSGKDEKGEHLGKVRARQLYERAAAIYEKELGPSNLEMATVVNNLAVLLYRHREYAQARALFERALSIREVKLGHDHHQTAQILNNLALLLKDQGDLPAARCLAERALAVSEKSLGSEHPTIVRRLINLASLVEMQGEFAEANSLYERALAINGSEPFLSSSHSFNVDKLIEKFCSEGHFSDAEQLCERAITIFGATEDLTRCHLARLLLAAGQPTEALNHATVALAFCENSKKLTLALVCANIAADALDALDRTEEAAALRGRYGLPRSLLHRE
jgi:Tfp pilus assembly protein PilF